MSSFRKTHITPGGVSRPERYFATNIAPLRGATHPYGVPAQIPVCDGSNNNELEIKSVLRGEGLR